MYYADVRTGLTTTTCISIPSGTAGDQLQIGLDACSSVICAYAALIVVAEEVIC